MNFLRSFVVIHGLSHVLRYHLLECMHLQGADELQEQEINQTLGMLEFITLLC